MCVFGVGGAKSQEKFDSSSYRAHELYGYTSMSFYDLECDMAPSRLPQPSSKAQETVQPATKKKT